MKPGSLKYTGVMLGVTRIFISRSGCFAEVGEMYVILWICEAKQSGILCENGVIIDAKESKKSTIISGAFGS